MISDIRSLEEGADLKADICIIGGGAAAIAMATRFINTGLDVCIFESGGMGLEKQAQSLSDGETSGIPYFDLIDTRYRMFGGSTYRWGARGAPMTDMDFQERPWIPHSGWPIARKDLEPYYEPVHKLINHHSPFHYDERVWDTLAIVPPKFDASVLKYTAFQFGKNVLLGDHYKDVVKNASNIRLYLHANVTNLQCNDAATHINHVDVKTLSGKSFQIKATNFILACGGIENPRVLLLSNTVVPNGLCNDNDLVGRFFMEHPTVSAGAVSAHNIQSVLDVFSPGLIRGRLVEIGLALSPQLQESESCLNAVASTKVVVTQDSTQALRELLWNLKHRRMPQQLNWYYKNKWLLQRLAAVFRDPIGIVSNIYRHLAGKPKRLNIDQVYLEIRNEQAPNPDSRVTLGKRRDALGFPCAHLHWAMTEKDKRTMRVMAQTFGRELERLKLGTLHMDPWLSSDALTWPSDMVGGHHHMGTTRMSQSAESGIVDRDCKAHGLDNLYIAGSSVFPTSGYVNPTSTILALAMRLADHLQAKMA